jgi:hypothetical protein
MGIPDLRQHQHLHGCFASNTGIRYYVYMVGRGIRSRRLWSVERADDLYAQRVGGTCTFWSQYRAAATSANLRPELTTLQLMPGELSPGIQLSAHSRRFTIQPGGGT